MRLFRALRRLPVQPRFPTLVILAALLLSACVPRGSRFDSSWGPWGTHAWESHLEPGPVIDLPRFSLRAETLPSGLRLGLESGSPPGLVAVVTVVGSGSSADPPGREGLAHLVEHLVYHARAGDMPEGDRLARLGALYNADTGLDATRFYEAGPASELPALLALASERLLRPLAGVDERDLERERAIVENELNQRNEIGVYGNVMAWMQRSLFHPGHPYARPVGGTATTLRRLTLTDARAFAAAHYRPENASMVVTGDAGMKSFPGLVAALGAAARGRTGTAPKRAEPPAALAHDRAPSPPPDTLRAAVPTPEIWLVYDLGENSGADGAIHKVLTGSASEAMVRERLLPERDVLAVDFHVIEQLRSTFVACQIVLEHDRRRSELAEKARNLIWSLWSDSGPPSAVTWEGWRQGTVVDLRQAALASAVLDAEPFVDRALDRAVAFHVSGQIDGYDRTLATIAALRPQDVSGQAFALLAPERARTLFLDPPSAADAPSPGPIGLARPDSLTVGDGPFRAAALGPPPPVPAPEGLSDTRIIVLPNGLSVVLVPRFRFPAVTALLGFFGGAAALPSGVLELVRAVDPRAPNQPSGGAWRTEAMDGPGFTADLVHTDRRNLPLALSLLTNRLQAVARTNWGRLLPRAQALVASTPPTVEDPRRAAAFKVQSALYGAHPFARRVRSGDLLALRPADLQALPYLYNPRNAVLVVVGDIDVEKAGALAASWLGGWQGAPGTGRLGPPPVPAPADAVRTRVGPETMLLTQRPVVSQVELTFSCRLAAPASAREAAAQRVAAHLLQGILTERIRERAGAAYSVGSTVTVLPAGGAHLQVAMSVETRRLHEVLGVLRGEVAALTTGRIDGGAFSQARWLLSRGESLRFQTGRQLAVALFQMLARGLPPGSLATAAEEMRHVEQRDLGRTLAPCAADPILSLVGDEKLIRGAL